MSGVSDVVHDLAQSISWRHKLMPAVKEADRKAPRVGDTAPDFTLMDPAGENPVTLPCFRAKRVVDLFFGSYTWRPFVKGTPESLHEIFEQYRDRVEFLQISIR